MKGKRKALRQEVQGLQQTLSTGKELAALAAGHSLKVDPKALAVQLLKNPKVQRTATAAGGEGCGVAPNPKLLPLGEAVGAAD